MHIICKSIRDMQSKKIDYSLIILLTPHNYFQWKQKKLHKLQCKGLYQITMDTEVERTFSIKKKRYVNCMDEAYKILCLSISPKLQFHIESCTTPYVIWTKLKDPFGKHDKMRGHILEVKITSLHRMNFYNI
jgi:hypothetical protein